MKEGFPDRSPQASITNVIPAKSMIGIPWRVALALIDRHWVLRNAIVWHKPNSMPSSVKDRLSNTYEHVFHFVKSKKYYYNLESYELPAKDAELLLAEIAADPLETNVHQTEEKVENAERSL